MEKELQATCQKLLEEKKVNLIIGYERGNLPLRSTPCFIKEVKDVEKLIFDITCGNNLGKYLQRTKIKEQKPKIGIVTKGCDGRAIVQLIVEGQIHREDVVVIGVHCEGVIDIKKLEKKLNGKEILKYKFEGNTITVEGKLGTTSLKGEEVMSDSCIGCKYPNPPIYDVFVGKPREATQGKELEVVEKLEKMSSDERWEYFEREINKCIRCYACRNACPLCYCEECFVDRTNPQWFGKSINISDTMMFQVGRILDMAGRCVECGTCERACPIGVNLTPIRGRIEKEILDRFGYTAGLDLEATPPMAVYKEDDKQEFIM